MARHSISEAARLAGTTRNTIYRRIRSGKLTKGMGEDGQPYVETAELIRVFGELQVDTGTEQSVRKQPDTPLRRSGQNTVAQLEIALLRERIDEQADERERERQQLTRQIDDLRERLDRSEERHSAVLRLLQAHEEARPIVTPSPSEKPRGGFWARLTGRAA